MLYTASRTAMAEGEIEGAASGLDGWGVSRRTHILNDVHMVGPLLMHRLHMLWPGEIIYLTMKQNWFCKSF